MESEPSKEPPSDPRAVQTNQRYKWRIYRENFIFAQDTGSLMFIFVK